LPGPRPPGARQRSSMGQPLSKAIYFWTRPARFSSTIRPRLNLVL
jgi:hypothetical protein